MQKKKEKKGAFGSPQIAVDNIIKFLGGLCFLLFFFFVFFYLPGGIKVVFGSVDVVTSFSLNPSSTLFRDKRLIKVINMSFLFIFLFLRKNKN